MTLMAPITLVASMELITPVALVALMPPVALMPLMVPMGLVVVVAHGAFGFNDSYGSKGMGALDL